MNAYELITWYYGDKVAERSQVPLINHIDEGIRILKHLGADSHTIDAYCLHPIIQSDFDFVANIMLLAKMDPLSVALAVEYRHTANAWLSDKVLMGPYFTYWIEEPKVSVMPEVNMMLIADKVQNDADFEIYHKGRHERTKELETYFGRWLKALGVDLMQYIELRKVAKRESYRPIVECLKTQ